MNSAFALLPTLILAGLAAFGGNAQAPVVRTETGVVVVDALVRDKRGKPVSGLGAKDFRLFEDGKEQPIASFAPKVAGAAGQPEPLYLTFLFDVSGYAVMGRVAAERSARRDAASFAGAYAGPNRYLAVMNLDVKGELSTAQDFTTVGERVRQAAEDVSHVAGAGRGVPRGFPAKWPALDAIATIANSMAAMNGRKLLVVFGAPWWAGWRGAPPSIESDCNRAKVSVYTTDPDLKSLADATGGRLIGKDVARELGEIAGERDKGYALGFKPADPADGNCHPLRVGLETKGLVVESRNAYCTEKAQDLLAGKAEGTALEASAAGSSAVNAAASMELPYFYSSPGIALVDLTMDLDLQSLKFTKLKGKQHAELDLVGLAYGTDGGVAAKFSDAVPLDFDTPAEAGTVQDYPYRYERQFRLPAGRYTVRVAFGSGGQNFGKAEAPLTIDPWDGKSFAVSAIALSSDARKVADLTSDLDPALLEGRKDLIAKSIQVFPSGSDNFRDSDPCAGYLEIQDPLMAGPDPPGYDVALRVLDRRTGEEKAAGGFVAADYVRPGIPVAPVLIDVPIAGLARGSYTLEVKVSRLPENAAVVRTVEFQIDEGDSEAASGNGTGQTSKELQSALPALTPAEAPAVLAGSAPPSGSEQERLLASARQAALDYASRLPNFLCTETVRRTADHGRGFFPVDTLTVEVGYYDREDRYQLTEVNKTPVHTQYGDTRGTISRGEFGSNLRKIFDPASAADFRFERWTTFDGRPAAAYSYRVERSKAHYQIEAAEGDKLFRGLVGLRGEVIVDRETFGVLRLNYRADDILPGFPVRRTTVTVDYGDVKIGDKVYPLPLKATVDLQDKLAASRNEVTFHSYRQFSSDSSLNFGEEAPEQQP